MQARLCHARSTIANLDRHDGEADADEKKHCDDSHERDLHTNIHEYESALSAASMVG